MVSLRSWIMVEFYYTSTLCERRWTFKCSVESWLYGRLLCLLLKLHVFPRAALFKADPLQCKSPCYKRVTSGEKRTIVFFRYTNDYITLIILTGTCSRGTRGISLQNILRVRLPLCLLAIPMEVIIINFSTEKISFAVVVSCLQFIPVPHQLVKKHSLKSVLQPSGVGRYICHTHLVKRSKLQW